MICVAPTRYGNSVRLESLTYMLPLRSLRLGERHFIRLESLTYVGRPQRCDVRQRSCNTFSMILAAGRLSPLGRSKLMWANGP